MKPVMHLPIEALWLPVALAFLSGAAGPQRAPILLDQRGASFTLSALHGTPIVLTFIATHCEDACPLINAQFAQLRQQIRRSHAPVRLLTVTLDPEHDHLTDMQRLARTFGADPRSWVLATGSRRDIARVMQRFGVVAERSAHGYADIHTTLVYLLDSHGALIKTILAGSNLTADLFTALQHNWRKLNS